MNFSTLLESSNCASFGSCSLLELPIDQSRFKPYRRCEIVNIPYRADASQCIVLNLPPKSALFLHSPPC